MESRSLSGIDMMKFICAILVVAIHTEPLRGLGAIEDGFNIFTRYAVPFFYFASGYFLYKGGINKERLIKQAKRLTGLYLTWTVIYFPALIIVNYRANGGFLGIVKSVLWDGSFTQLWYLVGSIYAILIILLLHSFIDERKILVSALAVYYMGIAISTYGPLWEPIIGFRLNIPTRNAVFYAFPFMYFGLYLAKERDNLFAKCSFWKKIIGFAVCSIVISAEALLMIKKLHTGQTMLWIALPFGTAFLFEAALSWNIKSFNTKVLREASTLIYTSHCLFQFIVSEAGIGKGAVQFFIVLSVSILFAFVIIHFAKKIVILKKLY